MAMTKKSLTPIEPLPVPVLGDNRITIPSWPVWATSRGAELVRTIERTAPGKPVSEVFRLPAGKMPTEAMRPYLVNAEREHRRLMEMTPENSREADARALVAIAGMMKALAGPRLDEAGAEATAIAYMAAVEDVPVWAIESAIRKWYRGACGTGHDYNWRPSPSALRSVALTESQEVFARWRMCLGLLTAKPMKEFTPEHCQGMLSRLAELFRSITNREDPIARRQREWREHAEAQVAVDKKKALEDLAAHDRTEAHAAHSLGAAGY
jgi:hypothetical protein